MPNLSRCSENDYPIEGMLMKLAFIALALLGAFMLSSICSAAVGVLASGNSYQGANIALAAAALFNLLILAATLLLFWRWSALHSPLAHIGGTIALGVLQLLGLVLVLFFMVVALNR